MALKTEMLGKFQRLLHLANHLKLKNKFNKGLKRLPPLSDLTRRILWALLRIKAKHLLRPISVKSAKAQSKLHMAYRNKQYR